MEKENKAELATKNLPLLYEKNGIQRVASKDIAVIKEHGLQLSKLRKERPLDLELAISKLITGVYDLVNVGKQIKAEAITMLASMIIENYWYLKIDEIDLVFKNGIMGKYGKIYDRIDASVIFDWLHQYDVSDEVIGLYEEKASKFKEREHDSSILNEAAFRDRMKGLFNVVEPFQDGVTDEEHKENVRKQAESLMANNKPIDEKTN